MAVLRHAASYLPSPANHMLTAIADFVLQALEELENGSDAESVEDSDVDSDEGDDVDFDEVRLICTRPRGRHRCSWQRMVCCRPAAQIC